MPGAAIERARAMRKAMSPQELTLWLRLRALKAEGWHFRRQSPEGAYTLDFVCRKAKLVVEVDGVHHAGAEQSKHDRKRDGVMMRNGFSVLRFWAGDVANELDGVMLEILEALSASEVQGATRVEPLPALKGGARYRKLVRLGLRLKK